MVEGETIMTCDYPLPDTDKIDQSAINEMKWLQAFITGVRNIRGEMNISPSKALPILVKNADSESEIYLSRNQTFLNKFGRFSSVSILSDQDNQPESATALLGEMRILVPLGSFIDASAEIARLNKELEKTERDISSVSGRLDNKAFVDKAPEAVINKAQLQLKSAETTKTTLLEQIQRMQQFIESE
jgi:valyl-tRNA synthetase